MLGLSPGDPYYFCPGGSGGGGGGGGGDVAVPVTTADVEPPFQVKLMFVPKAPAVVGLNRTTTVWLPPGPSTNALPEITRKGATVEAVPLAVLPPEFMTVNERSADPPTTAEPKSAVWGVMDRAAGAGGGGGGDAGISVNPPVAASMLYIETSFEPPFVT